MYSIVATRFTNETKKENDDYKTLHNIKGCIYGSPQEMSPKIMYDSIVFVVEMNNTQNKIEGIGLIRNKPYTDKYYIIYNKQREYNRYIYKSDYYIDSETLMRYNPTLVEELNYICFREKSHIKRGHGFSTITPKLIKKCKNTNINIQKDIKNAFINIFSDNSQIN
jgi:hypothetical protein